MKGAVRLVAAWSVLLAAGMSGGCRAPRDVAYPIGLYSVPNPDAFPTLRAAGFNLVVSSASDEVLEAARRAGMGVVARPGTLAGAKGFDDEVAGRVVRRFDRHPAVLAWYLSDEPDLDGVSPEVIRAAHACVRAAGARKPTALALFNGRHAWDYVGVTDWLIQDRYPVPWLPLADFPKHLRLARHAAGRDRTLFAVIQAFDWSPYPELLPRQSGLRPPTYEEMRAMTWLALTQGANGLLYYCYDDGRWDMQQEPETWQALCRVVAEVRSFETLFTAKAVWRPLGAHYPDRRAAVNEALDPTIQATVRRIERGDALFEAGDYLVAVNTTDRRVAWEFAGSSSPGELLDVVNKGRWLNATRGRYTDVFDRYDVHIYGPLPGSSTAR
jgi:hypothetical protein